MVEERNWYASGKGPRLDIYAPAEWVATAENGYQKFPEPEFVTTPRPGGPTCTFDTYPRSVAEGASITFTVNTTGIPSGSSTTRWAILESGPGLADPVTDFGDRWLGSFDINSSGRGTFTITITADMWTEGAETFRVNIWINDDARNSRQPIATSEPITIVDTSTGNQSPPGSDIRNPAYFKGRFGGTSAACPHVTGIIACALETYPNMTSSQALSYIQTYASHGVLRDTPFNTDFNANQWFNDEYILFNGPNMYAAYQPNTRPNQVYPVNEYQARPLTGAVYPRTRNKRTL
jgi:hypothetical protein